MLLLLMDLPSYKSWKLSGRDKIPHLEEAQYPNCQLIALPLVTHSQITFPIGIYCFSPHKISSISGQEIDKHALLNIYIAPLRELSQTWVDYMNTVPAPPSLIDDICGSVFSCPSTSYPFHFTPVSRWLGGAVVVSNLCNAKLWGLQACFNKTQRQGCRMYIVQLHFWIFQLTIEKDSGL